VVKNDPDPLAREAVRKLDRLKTSLARMGSAVLAFSGGVDSAFLLRVGKDVLGESFLAVIGRSASYPRSELLDARSLASACNVEWLEVDTRELSLPEYTSNPPERCYYCKRELFGRLKGIAAERGYAAVLDGANADDLADLRPGKTAAKELGVRSPLAEAGLSKGEIRFLSRRMGLPTWDKPAAACLASRIPYGDEITPEKLRQVERAESFLHRVGFRTVRVRHHGELARIELPLEDLATLAAEPTLRSKVVDFLKEVGFTFVAADLAGHRSGSMNEALGAKRGAGGKNRSSADAER